MNNDDLNNQILKLRNKGYGYKRIAKELSISVSAARYVCLKNDEKSKTTHCKNCSLSIISIEGKRKKVFCSDKCRYNWWNKNQNKVNKKAYYTHQCKNCNKEFVAYGNKMRIYCSQECYIKSKISKVGVSHEAK